MGRESGPPPVDPVSGLERELAEALALSDRVRAVVTEDPDRRLVAVRAYADRLQGIIESVALRVLALNNRNRTARAQYDELLSKSAGAEADRLVSRGLAADERRWRYQRANAPYHTQSQELELEARHAEEVQRFLRWLDEVFERHRLEALSMSNRKRTITAAEYHVFASEGGEAGSSG